MIGNALLATTVVFMGLGFFLLQECQFLIPYRRLLFLRYGAALMIFASALFLNLFAAVYMICRKLFLKDTGRKLAHVEKQVRSGSSISEELSRRLKE
ncbi:MAG: hypothetical protein M3Z85_11355 [Acidobacteriota bacterium]|nr:hypothetical protein [Acidobacteriota bacterium]